jgi:hypothetical protein
MGQCDPLTTCAIDHDGSRSEHGLNFEHSYHIHSDRSKSNNTMDLLLELNGVNESVCLCR